MLGQQNLELFFLSGFDPGLSDHGDLFRCGLLHSFFVLGNRAAVNSEQYIAIAWTTDTDIGMSQ
jgi:hypothetical protein